MVSTQQGFTKNMIGQPPLSVQWFPHAYVLTITPASVAANTSAEQTFTLTGATVKDAVFVSGPSITAGLLLGECRISAADTIAINWGNLTAGGLTPPAGDYFVILCKAKT